MTLRAPSGDPGCAARSCTARRAATVLLLATLLPALAVAGPLSSYVLLPECCRGECTADRCPIEARRHAGGHETGRATSAQPPEQMPEAPSCHEEASNTGAARANPRGHERMARSIPSLQAPRDCGSVSDSLTPVPRSELPTRAASTHGGPGSAASTPASEPLLERRVLGAEPRGPPSSLAPSAR